MAKNDYWNERENINRNIKRDKELAKEIDIRFKRLRDDIQKEINAEISNYADKENITRSEVYKRAKDVDIKAYQRKAKEYTKTKNLSKQANYEMRLYNLTMRVSRLELLKANIGLEMVKTFDDMEKFLKNELSIDGYKELERQASILNDTIFNDYSKIVEKVVNGSFHNATFSSRIWQYQAELKAELDKLLTRAITNGHNPRKTARELRKTFDVTKNQAETLMRTESARIQGDLQRESYDSLGFDEYVWITEPILPNGKGACTLCQDIAKGGPYKVKDMEIGVNMIPAHPNCRCSTAPYFDRDKWDKELKSRGL